MVVCLYVAHVPFQVQEHVISMQKEALSNQVVDVVALLHYFLSNLEVVVGVRLVFSKVEGHENERVDIVQRSVILNI